MLYSCYQVKYYSNGRKDVPLVIPPLATWTLSLDLQTLFYENIGNLGCPVHLLEVGGNLRTWKKPAQTPALEL